MSQNVQERNTALTKKRWLVLAASCLINLCIGAMYAWSVFAAPMAEELSQLNGVTLTAASLSIVFSIGNGDGFITMIAGGFITEKLGPKWVIFAGGVLFGLGFIVCGLAQNTGMLDRRLRPALRSCHGSCLRTDHQQLRKVFPRIRQDLLAVSPQLPTESLPSSFRRSATC